MNLPKSQVDPRLIPTHDVRRMLFELGYPDAKFTIHLLRRHFDALTERIAELEAENTSLKERIKDDAPIARSSPGVSGLRRVC